MTQIMEAVDRMAGEIACALGNALHSVWLYGSLVMDDFRPGWSDIDFLVLTGNPLSREQAEALLPLRQRMTARETECPWYRCFEGVMMSLEEYLTRDYRRVVYWGTTGQRITARYQEDVFARFELARLGKRIRGSAERTLFEQPSREEMLSAIRKHAETVRTFAAQTNESLYSCGWLLDTARCVYTLRRHDVTGKTQAGEWALREHIFPEEAALEQTLVVRRNPLAYKDRPEIRQWLSGLGPTVQRDADVLERELAAAEAQCRAAGCGKDGA